MRTDLPRASAGLTIVEVLVGILLLSIIALVVLAPLTSFFRLTTRSAQQVSATQQAQQVLEGIRSDWLTPGLYDQRCATTPLPPGTSVTLSSLTLDGAVTGSAGLNASCTGNAPDLSPVRRVSVQVTVNGTQSVLNADVARP